MVRCDGTRASICLFRQHTTSLLHSVCERGFPTPGVPNTSANKDHKHSSISSVQLAAYIHCPRGSPTYAAVAAKISARFALVIRPTLRAKAAVKTATMPSLMASEVTQYNPTMDPIRKMAATTILMTATVRVMECSLNRPIRWRPSRESSSCFCVSFDLVQGFLSSD